MPAIQYNYGNRRWEFTQDANPITGSPSYRMGNNDIAITVLDNVSDGHHKDYFVIAVGDGLKDAVTKIIGSNPYGMLKFGLWGAIGKSHRVAIAKDGVQKMFRDRYNHGYTNRGTTIVRNADPNIILTIMRGYTTINLKSTTPVVAIPAMQLANVAGEEGDIVL